MRICVMGGAGYVGSMLVPALLNDGHEVTVLDTFYYGNPLMGHPRLKMITGDVRDMTMVNWVIKDTDAVVHLACISNDPSFDLKPTLARSINLDCFHHTISAIRRHKTSRFIFASSSSVYGVREEPEVTEELQCRPLTDYSKYKLQCEKLIEEAKFVDTSWTILRPATICGYAPRLRLDVIVNALAIDAISKGEITIHGGEQIRPNLNIRDMVRAYKTVLKAPGNKVTGKTYNVGGQNNSVEDLAKIVKRIIPAHIRKEQIKDKRSYRIDSSKIKRELDFSPAYGIPEAVASINEAYIQGLIQDPENSRYHNINRLKELINEGAV